MKSRLQFHLLTALSKASPPLPKRVAQRFSRSAKKRDPSNAHARYHVVSTELRRLEAKPPQRSNDLGKIRAVGPIVSIVMPVHNTPGRILMEAIESVANQTYPNWELCICDDASSDTETLDVLERYRGRDWRIKIARSDENLHIARATNLCAELATGEFIGFMDHDDVLEPDALDDVVRELRSDERIDLLYTDEDKIASDGSFVDPYLKPDWSPEHLCSVMYVLHFTVVRKKLFFELGGLRHEFSGAQDYDFVLRAAGRARKVHHVPKVLYHWRKIPGSAAAELKAKPDALRKARLCLMDFAKSRDPGAEVVDGLLPGTFRVRWSVDHDRPVTLLILTDARSKEVEGRGEILLLENFIDSILAKSTFRNFRILVVDNHNIPERLAGKLRGVGARIVSYDLEGEFNFSDKMNFALSQVETEDVILLNDDLEVIAEDWIEALLEHSRKPEVGAVGARLLFANGHLQHGGVVLGVNGSAAHLFHNMAEGAVGYYGYSHLVRNYSAVTGAVLATRMSIVREVGGFDQSMRIDFNDIDFCLAIRDHGYRIVYTPFSELYHFEGSTQVRTVQDDADRDAFLAKWSNVVARDPHYNPRLPRDRADCQIMSWADERVDLTSFTLPAAPARAPWAPTGRAAGVNLVGPLEVVSGLGVSARGYDEALRAGGIPLTPMPWRRGYEHQRQVPYSHPTGTDLHPINVLHANADSLASMRKNLGEDFFEDRYSIAVCFWELPELRPEWLTDLDLMDEIWVPSKFMARTFAASLSIPVRVVRPALAPPRASDALDRSRLGLRADSFVFFYAFDVSSYVDRKNPFALIEAFEREFGDDSNVQLLLKLNYSEAGSALQRLKAAESERVVLLDETLDQAQMDAIWSCIDAYVSPHRSEGLGLTIIEAQFSGKPVIATRFGGVTEFVTEETALPIEHDLIEIEEDIGPYASGYVWADPKVASIQNAMRRLVDDPALAHRLGQAGRQRVEQLFGRAAAGAAIRHEVERIMKTRDHTDTRVSATG